MHVPCDWHAEHDYNSGAPELEVTVPHKPANDTSCTCMHMYVWNHGVSVIELPPLSLPPSLPPGKLNKTGVVIPTSKEIYEPILEHLKSEGIAAKTTNY